MFVSEQCLLEWTIRSKSPVGIIPSFLRAVEEFLSSPVGEVRTSRWLTVNCSSDPYGCGGLASVEFPLPMEWIYQFGCRQLPNLDGECSSCEEQRTLSDLLPYLSESVKYSAAEEAAAMRGALMQPYDVFLSHAGCDKER